MVYSMTLLLLSVVVAGIFAYPFDNRQTNDTSQDSFRPVSLPTDFGSYDSNANGYIDLEELARVTGTMLDDAKKPFTDADIDDDDQVSPSEFERAPWSLAIFNRGDLVSEENDGDYDQTEDDNNDGEEANMFDNADDILVDVGKPITEEEEEPDMDKSSIETLKENDDEITEEPLEEEDDESRNLDSDEDETDEDEEEGEENDDVDPLLDDDLLREETVLSEDEFVENAIY